MRGGLRLRHRLLSAAALGCLALFVPSCRRCGDPPAPGALGAPDASSADAAEPDARVERARARARVPAIAWASFSAHAHAAGASGYADVEAKTAATEATPFEAASIAKMVIAVSVMQLVEDGRLSLDEDVSSHVGFPIRARAPITLRHLLSHTSAIVDGPETAAGRTVPLGDFLRGYMTDAGALLDAAPGTVHQYSNVGPSLAALVVERVTRTPFAERAARSIFEPLGMRAASFDAAPPTGVARAVPYAARGDGFVRLAPPSHALYPVVDLFASALDLVRFGQAILRGGELDGARVLRPESVAELLRVPFDAAPGDALGFQVRTFGGARVFGHEGEDAGASTGLYVDPDTKTGALVLANGDAFVSDDADRAAALGDLVGELMKEARTAWPASAVAPAPGRLRSPDGD